MTSETRPPRGISWNSAMACVCASTNRSGSPSSEPMDADVSSTTTVCSAKPASPRTTGSASSSAPNTTRSSCNSSSNVGGRRCHGEAAVAPTVSSSHNIDELTVTSARRGFNRCRARTGKAASKNSSPMGEANVTPQPRLGGDRPTAPHAAAPDCRPPRSRHPGDASRFRRPRATRRGEPDSCGCSRS